jgi:hypothetical protein
MQSTSAETGALTVAGGLGVKKDLRVGGEILSEGEKFCAGRVCLFSCPIKARLTKSSSASGY